MVSAMSCFVAIGYATMRYEIASRSDYWHSLELLSVSVFWNQTVVQEYRRTKMVFSNFRLSELCLQKPGNKENFTINVSEAS